MGSGEPSLGNHANGFVLPNYTLMQALLPVDQLVACLAFHQTRHWDSCPARDNQSDLFEINFLFE
jgi:hypothetical protein